MELRRSCVLPNAPSLPATDSDTSGRILREHSGNRGHSYDRDVHIKRASSQDPECYLHSSSIQPQYAKSEEQIEAEFQQVWKLLQSCETYRKYREKKPKTAKAEAKWRENVWPDNLERAFFRGTVPFLSLHLLGPKTELQTQAW
jgi:hypothetical protein